MKKFIILLLSLGLLLTLLSSCEMFVPDPTERPSNWWESAEPAGSAEPSPSQTLWQEGVGPDYDRRFVHDDICSTKDTVYFRSDKMVTESVGGTDLIYYADKATGICLPLCGKPECTHSDGNCNAYAQGGMYSGLTNYNGRLYWIGQKGTWLTGGGQWYVFSMAYDGTDRREVRKIPSDWVSGQMQTRTVFHRGHVYTCNLRNEVVNGKAKEVVNVVAYPLDEGDGDGMAILRAEEVQYNHVALQPYEEYVYIAFMTEDDVFELHRWDTRVGELETLYRGEAPLYWAEQFWVTEDGVLFGTRELTDPDAYNEEDWEWPPLEYPEESWEYAIYRFSFETSDFELVSRFHIADMYFTNVRLIDGLVIANWSEPDPHIIRVLVKDLAGETLLDATFDDVDWCIFPNAAMGCYGMDEEYLYFCKLGQQYISVSLDGSEIRLLFDRQPD